MKNSQEPYLLPLTSVGKRFFGVNIKCGKVCLKSPQTEILVFILHREIRAENIDLIKLHISCEALYNNLSERLAWMGFDGLTVSKYMGADIALNTLRVACALRGSLWSCSGLKQGQLPVKMFTTFSRVILLLRCKMSSIQMTS